MNDDRIERALGAGPPDEAAYRVRGSAFWRAATPTDPAARDIGLRATAWTRRLATLALGLIALLVAVQLLPATNGPAALPLGDFPMYKGGPGRTGEVGGPAPIAPVGTICSVSIPGTTESSPAIAGGVAYVVGGDHRAHALSMVDGADSCGRRRVRHMSDPRAYADGLMFVLGGDFSVSVLDAASGALRWRSGPTRSTRSRVRSCSTGSWSPGHRMASSRSIPPRARHAGRCRPAAGSSGRRPERTASSPPGATTASSMSSTRPRASSVGPVQIATGAFATPVIRDGVLYATAPTAQGDTLFALDVSTGVRRWAFRSPSGLAFRTPSVDAGAAYVGTVGGPTYAVSTAGGSLLWTNDDVTLSVAAIAIAGDDLIACTDDLRVIAFDRLTGSTHWSIAIGGLADAGTAVGQRPHRGGDQHRRHPRARDRPVTNLIRD